MARKIAVTLVAVALVLAGCRAEPAVRTPDPNVDLQRLQSELQAARDKLAELERQKGTTPGSPVNLVDPHYNFPASQTTAWQYRQSLSADFDGDGLQEKLWVITNPARDSRGEWGWDDGHPWQVYIEELDGTRTMLFARWVQMGRLDVMLRDGVPDVVILEHGGHGAALYRITYRGPQKFEAVELAQVSALRHTEPVNP